MPNPFPLLADPQTYQRCSFDLIKDAAMREHWMTLLRDHFPTLLEHAHEEAVARGENEIDVSERLARAQAEYEDIWHMLEANPAAFGHLDIYTTDLFREKVYREAGFEDPYRLVKERETAAALQLLPDVLAQLDAVEDPAARARMVIEGVFAGNIFDLGLKHQADAFSRGEYGFLATRNKLKPRPWLVDDLDRWIERVTQAQPWNAAVLFVDNAGVDVILGMIPFARDLLQRGVTVILAANDYPALNDITLPELDAALDRISVSDPFIASMREQGKLQTIGTGNRCALIDLADVSDALCEAVTREAVDLVILEGMGRALESNYDATFRCDALKIAMVKEQSIADWLGGAMMELVMRFEDAGV